MNLCSNPESCPVCRSSIYKSKYPREWESKYSFDLKDLSPVKLIANYSEGKDMAVTPKNDDIVSVTRENLKVTDVSNGKVYVKDPASGGTRSYYLSDVKLQVTKAAPVLPKNWPPLADDAWASVNGGRVLHFIGGNFYRSSYGDLSSAYTKEEVLRAFPDLRLVYRNL